MIWFRIVPDAADDASGLAWVALRLGHGCAGHSLAASMLIGVAEGHRGCVRAGLGSLAAYAAFVGALLAG